MTEQEPIITPSRHKKKRWWLWLLASPFLLFSLLILLLYLPPVQWFAVNKASKLASESTGLDITVGRLDLRFPLDLLVRDVLAVEPESKDTLLALDRLKVELRLWKLFKKELEIEEVSINTERLSEAIPFLNTHWVLQLTLTHFTILISLTIRTEVKMYTPKQLPITPTEVKTFHTKSMKMICAISYLKSTALPGADTGTV